MKKLIFIVTAAIIFLMNPLIGAGKGNTNSEYQVIPDDSIRLRILANSNSDADQEIKRAIRDEVNSEITKWVLTLEDINTARDVIEANLINIEDIVQEVLEEYGSDQTFEVTFGDVQFPAKVYGNQVYPAGVYEALLITLGEGEGENWWCVLFPPLCFLDFSNGTSISTDDLTVDASGEQKVEVKFFLFEWFEKIINLLFN